MTSNGKPIVCYYCASDKWKRLPYAKVDSRFKEYVVNFKDAYVIWCSRCEANCIVIETEEPMEEGTVPAES